MRMTTIKLKVKTTKPVKVIAVQIIAIKAVSNVTEKVKEH